ncbi:MAG: hypothetical protein A2Y79_11690 [Deltaproteobacteria bacterium RBG_13_43_22]|nr:MAG: hypothetical protein A2Y79_11690 [Deltaproteobacteria bacterium RBG_13_43_22]
MFGMGAKEAGILLGLVAVIPFWKIFSKAGFSGWLSLTLVVPFLNIIVLFYLGFAEWPVHRELNQLKKGSGNVVV